MKYIINGYSPSMLSEHDVIIIQKELEYEEFQALAYQAKSMIGHQDLARNLKVEYNPGNIIINPDDICLSVFTTGGKLPKRFNTFDDIPEGVAIKFVCMQFIKNN